MEVYGPTRSYARQPYAFSEGEGAERGDTINAPSGPVKRDEGQR